MSHSLELGPSLFVIQAFQIALGLFLQALTLRQLIRSLYILKETRKKFCSDDTTVKHVIHILNCCLCFFLWFGAIDLYGKYAFPESVVLMFAMLPQALRYSITQEYAFTTLRVKCKMMMMDYVPKRELYIFSILRIFTPTIWIFWFGVSVGTEQVISQHISLYFFVPCTILWVGMFSLTTWMNFKIIEANTKNSSRRVSGTIGSTSTHRSVRVLKKLVLMKYGWQVVLLGGFLAPQLLMFFELLVHFSVNTAGELHFDFSHIISRIASNVVAIFFIWAAWIHNSVRTRMVYSKNNTPNGSNTAGKASMTGFTRTTQMTDTEPSFMDRTTPSSYSKQSQISSRTESFSLSVPRTIVTRKKGKSVEFELRAVNLGPMIVDISKNSVSSRRHIGFPVIVETQSVTKSGEKLKPKRRRTLTILEENEDVSDGGTADDISSESDFGVDIQVEDDSGKEYSI